MPNYICRECGTHYSDRHDPPPHCPICEDARQYVRWEGQDWWTPEEVAALVAPRIEDEGEGITGIGTTPALAIGQRALMIRTGAGNILWDCIPVLTPALRDAVAARGGLSTIAISHPHFYGAMADWSAAFGGAPIHLHADDREWVQRDDPNIRYWQGDRLALSSEASLVRCGGHFPGGTVLHWQAAPGGKGALLTGDILTVTQDRRHVSVMWSYPNLVPVGPATLDRIEARLRPLDYDALFGAWWGRKIITGAKQAVAGSLARYRRAIAE